MDEKEVNRDFQLVERIYQARDRHSSALPESLDALYLECRERIQQRVTSAADLCSLVLSVGGVDLVRQGFLELDPLVRQLTNATDTSPRAAPLLICAPPLDGTTQDPSSEAAVAAAKTEQSWRRLYRTRQTLIHLWGAPVVFYYHLHLAQVGIVEDAVTATYRHGGSWDGICPLLNAHILDAAGQRTRTTRVLSSPAKRLVRSDFAALKALPTSGPPPTLPPTLRTHQDRCGIYDAYYWVDSAGEEFFSPNYRELILEPPPSSPSATSGSARPSPLPSLTPSVVGGTEDEDAVPTVKGALALFRAADGSDATRPQHSDDGGTGASSQRQDASAREDPEASKRSGLRPRENGKRPLPWLPRDVLPSRSKTQVTQRKNRERADVPQTAGANDIAKGATVANAASRGQVTKVTGARQPDTQRTAPATTEYTTATLDGHAFDPTSPRYASLYETWEEEYGETLRSLRGIYRTTVEQSQEKRQRRHFGSAVAWLGDVQFARADISDDAGCDVIVLSGRTSWDLFQQDFIPHRCVLIKDNGFHDQGLIGVSYFLDRLEGAFASATLQTQVPGAIYPQEISPAAIRQKLAKAETIEEIEPETAINLLDVRDVLALAKPHILMLQRFRVIPDALTRDVGPGKRSVAPTVPDHARTATASRYLADCLDFNLLGTTGSFSGPHLDALNGTWVRCVSGVKAWVVAVGLSSTDYEAFAREGVFWEPPPGKTRIIILEPGDVLWMPPGLLVVHAPITLDTCLMQGGMVWDHRRLPEIAANCRWISKHNIVTNEELPFDQIRAILEVELARSVAEEL